MESVIESFRVCRLSAPFFCALIKSFFSLFPVCVGPSFVNFSTSAGSGRSGKETVSNSNVKFTKRKFDFYFY